MIIRAGYRAAPATPAATAESATETTAAAGGGRALRGFVGADSGAQGIREAIEAAAMIEERMTAVVAHRVPQRNRWIFIHLGFVLSCPGPATPKATAKGR